MSTRKAGLLSLLAVAFLLITHRSSLITVFGQSSTATLSGAVMDEKGAVIPDVKVTVVNIATNLERQATTNSDGYFAIPLLPPGSYTVTAQRDGFSPSRIKDVALNVGDQRAIQIPLKVGQVGEIVTVVADNGIQESTAVGTVVDRQFVENIPLNGRSFQSLITLTPGAVLTPMLSINSGGSGQFSVNGQRTDANSFMVDGISANFGTAPGSFAGAQVSGNLPGLTAFGTTQSLVSVDAMQEFKVETSTYSAEYGRQPGGQISIVTRSGTNDFHGLLFNYLRNDVFDANDWFANRNGQRRPPLRQNDFGGAFGGPVLIPRLYDGHNRTFFFFSYEGLRLRLPQFTLANVPTLLLRRTAPAPLQPLLNAFPPPNGKDLGNGLAEFTASYSNPSSLNATSIRLDHTIGQKWRVFGRYNHVPSESRVRPAANLSLVSRTQFATQTMTVGVTSALTPRSSNEFRFNYSANTGRSRFYLDNSFGATPLSIDAVLPDQFVSDTSSFAWALVLPGQTSSGLPQVFFTNGIVQNQQHVNFVDNFSYAVGAHQLKFGLDYRRVMPFQAANTYRLTVLYRSQQELLSNSSGSGSSIAAAVATYPTFLNFSAYTQDTWKISRRLTINLGLRWDVNPAPGEAKGNDPLAVSQISNLATMQLAPHGTPLWKTAYNNFGPRLGLAYELRQQSGWGTLIRGGFGVFYDTGNNQGVTGLSGPFQFPFSVTRSVTGLTFPLSATQAAPPTLPSLSSPTPPYGSMAVFDPNLRLPYTLQWNVAAQQSLGKDQTLTVSYVGAAGRRLLQQRQLTLGAFNPSLTIIGLTTNAATSDYNALQIQFHRRLSRGLQALASYTWSHALDEDSTDNGTIIPVRGNASFDVRHNFGGAVTYDIPAPGRLRVVDALLGHWSVDGRIHAQSAMPVDIIASQVTNPADGALVGNRPNVIAGVPFYIDDLSVPGGRRINRAAFTIPAAGQFGNLGRNVLRGFGARQLDFALRRQFKLTEKMNLQLRAEAFNLFNNPNFGAIQTTLTAANFGQATNLRNRQLATTGLDQLYQTGGPRSFQLALRLQF